MIPIGPDFQDPVGSPNYPPTLRELSPKFGSNVTVTLELPQRFDVIASDLNFGDTLFYQWVLDYPPYLPGTTQIIENNMLGAPASGRTITQVVTCVGVSLSGPTQHRLKLIVADRPLTTPDVNHDVIDTTPPGQLTSADWPVTFMCPPPGSP